MVKYRDLKETRKRVAAPEVKYRPIEDVLIPAKPPKSTTQAGRLKIQADELGLDLDWEKKEKERQDALKKLENRPKVDIEKLREKSGIDYKEFLSQEDVSRINRQAHIDAGLINEPTEQKPSVLGGILGAVTRDNATDKTRATLAGNKTSQRVAPPRATLSGKPVRVQQSEKDGKYLSDGDIIGSKPKKESEPIDWENQLRGAGRSLVNLPRNLASGALNALEQGSELLTFGMQSNDIKPRTRESWEKMNQTNTNPNKPKTYEEYLASIDKMNQDTKDFQEKVASVGSEVTSDTTLFEKMVKGAAQSLPSSLMTAAMGGGLAGVAGAFVSNPIVVETIRTTPLFASGTHSGLKTAEELGLTGAKKYSYAVLSGLLEAGTERLSSLGLEGKLLGKKTSGGVGGTKEFLRAIFEESGSEMLNEVGQQLLTGQYTNYEDFELDFENIIVAGGSAALMGGFGAVGELSNGLKYRTVGTVDNQVIIETEDGRRENVNPEIVMRHQLANGRTARMAQEILKADTEIQELAKSFGEQEQTTDTMPLEDTTMPQEAFEVETEPSMPIEEKPLTEPLNEQKEEMVQEPNVIPPPETELQANEEKLNNMIEKGLIDTKRKRDVAKSLNQKIVEQGGQDRLEEIEPKKVKAPKVQEITEDTDLISSDDDLMVNNMAMEAEIEPMESTEPVTADLPEIEMMDGYKTSAIKKSLLKTENIPQAYKDNAVEPDPMLYETSQRIAREIEANQEIETKTYDVATKEVLTNHKTDPKLYQSKEGQAMIQALIKKNIALREQYKDNGFYQSQYEDLQKVWRETGTDLGQSLNMRKQLYGDTVEGKLIEAERIIEDSKTKEHKELEDRMNKIVDDIFEKTLELDENGKVKPDAEFDEVIAEIKKEFGLTNAWIQMLRRSLEEGTLTKVRMKEIIKEKMGIPTLTMAEVDKITEIMKRLDALDTKSETYAKDKEAILQDATMVYAQKDVTFWTKLSTYQTMAMLMNVKTTLRNEIGNLMGFTTAQVDDVFSFFFDEGIAKITKQRGTVNPRSPFKLKYKDGVKKSFEAYGTFLADASDNKYVKRRVFAPGSTMGKLEGVMGVMLSDARWKQPRIEFLLEQIAATEKYAKERGLEYDAEKAKLKENINFITDYDTFNFDSKLSQVLDGVVKSMNKIGNKDFGLGTLFAKFAKTPMNIIQYQLDHIGADLIREGIKLSKLSKKIGFENALKKNQGRVSRALGKTATGMTYVTLGALLSNLGAFVDEEEDKDVNNILEAQGIKGGYFNFSALSRSISSGKPSSYKDGDTVISVNWMLPVAPFLLLGSRFANAKDEKEAQDITDTVQSLLEAGGSSLQDFAELPFNRTLGILTNSYDSGMDKFNKLVGGTVTGFVPSVVKQVAQGIDPTSKQYSKNSGEAVVQQIKATIPGLRNTVPNRFDVTGETQTMTDNSTTSGNIFEMLLNPAYRDTIEADKDLQRVVELNKKVGLPSLPKITNGYFSYKSNRYEMTQEEHQEFQSTYWNAYKRTYNKKNDGNFVNAHDYAMNQAKINYLKKKKVKFETTSSGNLK